MQSDHICPLHPQSSFLPLPTPIPSNKSTPYFHISVFCDPMRRPTSWARKCGQLTHQWLLPCSRCPQQPIIVPAKSLSPRDWMLTGSVSCRPCVGYFSCRDDNNPIQKTAFPILSLYHQLLCFCLLFYDILYTLEVIKMSYFRPDHSTVIYFSYLEQPWVFALTFAAKRRFPDQGGELHTLVGIRIDTQEVAR